MEQKLRMGLFDPGMTYLHRVGLAGLYMTLGTLKSSRVPGLAWELEPDSVTLIWKGKGKAVFDRFFNEVFGISREGLIDFSVHRTYGAADALRLNVHEGILGTFLQHGLTRKLAKKSSVINYEFEEERLSKEIKPIQWYPHQDAAVDFFNHKGELIDELEMKGTLFPGAVVRHVAYTGDTKLSESLGRYLALLFAPVGTLFFRLYHRGLDGKRDERNGYAAVFPHLEDMSKYAKAFKRYVQVRPALLTADNLGDAGLKGLLELRARENLDDLGIRGCTVVVMGTVGWSKQQKTRTDVRTMEDIPNERLELFEAMERLLPNRIHRPKDDKQVRKAVGRRSKKAKTGQKKEGLFVFPSLCRGFFAENIMNGRPWFKSFGELIGTKKRAGIVSYEKGGLGKMVQSGVWTDESERKFVEAVHQAIRQRYGALAAQAGGRGESVKNRFSREYERIRNGLLRAKNQQVLRAELADLFSRAGSNKVLREEWPRLLPMAMGADWQKARDLALFGLASYAGKGSEAPIEGENNNEGVES